MSDYIIVELGSIDRIPYFSYLTKSNHSNVITCVALRHSDTILGTSFTAPDNLTNDHTYSMLQHSHTVFIALDLAHILATIINCAPTGI